MNKFKDGDIDIDKMSKTALIMNDLVSKKSYKTSSYIEVAAL